MPNAARALLPLLLGLAAACAPAATRPAPVAVTDAPSLVRAMHHRYAGSWYRTAAFRQATTSLAPDGTQSTDTARVFVAVPGRLRIETGAPADGRGALFAGDSLYVLSGGRAVRRGARRNEQLILGFDVYGQDPARTLAVLAEQGFDLARFHADTWEGRPVYVAGAAAGDLRTRQFWIDRERLVFVRMLEPDPRDSTLVLETRFQDYRPAGGGWIAPRVEMLSGGRTIVREEYLDLQVDVPLDERLFVP